MNETTMVKNISDPNHMMPGGIWLWLVDLFGAIRFLDAPNRRDHLAGLYSHTTIRWNGNEFTTLSAEDCSVELRGG